GVLGHADQGGEVAGGQAAAAPGVQDQQALLGRQGGGRGVLGAGRAAGAGGGGGPGAPGGRAAGGGRGRPARAGGRERRGARGRRAGSSWRGGLSGDGGGPGGLGRDVGACPRGGRGRLGGGGWGGHAPSFLARRTARQEGRIPHPISAFPRANIPARTTDRS